MVTAGDTRVIDPEFALYGPIGFDLGAFLGNLLLNAFAQPGHATAADDRRGQQDWVLDQARRFWLAFRACFLGLLRERAGEGYPGRLLSQAAHAAQVEVARNAYLQAIFADMLGFAACKMIRRILGFAHVIDFEAIEDPSRRAACEARALKLARRLLKHPADFASIDALIDAASVMAHHQQKE